jgi:hypothetical protein
VDQRLGFCGLSVYFFEIARFQERVNAVDLKLIDEIIARLTEMVFVLEKRDLVAAFAFSQVEQKLVAQLEAGPVTEKRIVQDQNAESEIPKPGRKPSFRIDCPRSEARMTVKGIHVI